MKKILISIFFIQYSFALQSQDTTLINVFLCPGEIFMLDIILNDTIIYDNESNVTGYNIEVFELTPIIFSGDTLLCEGTMGVLSSNAFNAYEWSTGAMTQSIQFNVSDTYSITTTDFNGCKSSSSLTVPTYLIEADISATNPICNGSNDGEINLENAGTYQGQLNYYLNDEQIEFNQNISQLSAGQFIITIQDEKGCTWIDSIELIDPPISILNIKEDSLFLDYGLNSLIETNADSEFLDFEWFPTTGIDCIDCQETEVNIDDSNWYYLSGRTTEGCLFTDSIYVEGMSNIPLFIPNVFTPLSNENGVFKIEGPNIIDQINEMQIFDRWGNQVFRQSENFGNNVDGWNGLYNGEKCHSGTYVVYAELLLLNGETYSLIHALTILY